MNNLNNEPNELEPNKKGKNLLTELLILAILILITLLLAKFTVGEKYFNDLFDEIINDVKGNDDPKPSKNEDSIKENEPIIDEDPIDDEHENSNDEISNWLNDIKDNEYVVTVIGSSYCYYCQQYYPVIKKLSNEYEFKLYFFDIDKLSDDNTNIVTSTIHLPNYEGYIPYTFITNNNEFISDTTGFVSESEVVNFLVNYQVVK